MEPPLIQMMFLEKVWETSLAGKKRVYGLDMVEHLLLASFLLQMYGPGFEFLTPNDLNDWNMINIVPDLQFQAGTNNYEIYEPYMTFWCKPHLVHQNQLFAHQEDLRWVLKSLLSQAGLHQLSLDCSSVTYHILQPQLYHGLRFGISIIIQIHIHIQNTSSNYQPEKRTSTVKHHFMCHGRKSCPFFFFSFIGILLWLKTSHGTLKLDTYTHTHTYAKRHNNVGALIPGTLIWVSSLGFLNTFFW